MSKKGYRMPNKTRGIRKADINHRKQYEKFVLSNGDPTVSSLIVLWNYWNTEYFDGSFKAPPIILLAEPSKPSRLGDYSPVGAYGTRSQIRIRPSLLTGTHPHMLPGDEYKKGRFLFIADIALHETIHLWQDEIEDDLEPAYHGHGPLFRDKCNEIGEKLGLPPVRTCKKRGKDAELPSCSHFPHTVRPSGYYQGAYVREHEEPRPLKGRLERLLKDFSQDQIVKELRSMGVVRTRHVYGGQESLNTTPLLKHEWFLDVFESACFARGINPDLTLSPSLADSLDTWLDEKLTRGSYFGAKFFPHEKESSLTEKLSEIIAQWEFIAISVLGQRVAAPPLPDLSFLVTHREALFGWVSEMRQRRTDSAIDRVLKMGIAG
jgi:hypothetical protein